jgi:hypothetical protein
MGLKEHIQTSREDELHALRLPILAEEDVNLESPTNMAG